MRLLGIALTALLLTGCAVVPVAPVAYAPEPGVRVRFHYGYAPGGYYYHHRSYYRGGYER